MYLPLGRQVVELDLSTVVPSTSGPKRPHDRVAVSDMKVDFQESLGNKVGFKGFGIPAEKHADQVPFTFEGSEYVMKHGKYSRHLEGSSREQVCTNSSPASSIVTQASISLDVLVWYSRLRYRNGGVVLMVCY